ncbi:hypothetical protein [Geodermatophilus nigrescens]|uniref:SurA N-terminal domain-containing protein n=1 Tax=Geodermatophilus nigrescens TaxID=1070870 RepID=A0A1M5Q112_9ACTN|nr:hypothetical protein [Geodermatophilus nigrescens]SHH07612.1 hypothetical protein SAMN05444351_3945 [Geodermatophilus nigrescens]
MKLRTTVAAVLLAAVVPVAAACGTTAEASSTTSTSSSVSTDTGTSTTGTGLPGGGGGPGGIDVSSVDTEAELVELVQEAYGDAGLDLHRGHQPVQDVLDEVLTISHDELHVRMDAGQNLAAVAEDLGIDPQELVDALTGSWGTAIDAVLASGEITEDEAERYRAALEEAFSFRVTWDGEEATPTFSGLDA